MCLRNCVAPTMWTSSSTLFAGITAQAQVANIRDVGELYRLLVSASQAELRVLVSGTPAAPFLEAGSDKLFQGAGSTVTAAVKILDFVHRRTGRSFSVREWIKTGKGDHFDLDAIDELSDPKI